ncbi:hypothetical protein ACWGOK_20550 [Streptomyces eurythermus]
MKRRMGLAARPFGQGRAGLLVRASELLTAGGAVLGPCSARDRRLAVAAGAALLAGSAALRFGVFHAGVASAEDPAYTVVPRRERLWRRSRRTLDGAEPVLAEFRDCLSLSPLSARTGRS